MRRSGGHANLCTDRRVKALDLLRSRKLGRHPEFDPVRQLPRTGHESRRRSVRASGPEHVDLNADDPARLRDDGRRVQPLHVQSPMLRLYEIANPPALRMATR